MHSLMERYSGVFTFIVGILLSVIGCLALMGVNSVTVAVREQTVAMKQLNDDFLKKTAEHDVKLENHEVRLDKAGL